MKSLPKVTLLTATVVVALHTPATFTAEAVRPVITADSKTASKSDGQKSACALGAPLGRYVENFLKEQEELGTELDKGQLTAGVQDAFANKSEFSDREIKQIPQVFEVCVKSFAQAKMEKNTADNEVKGREYREKFAKGRGVKTSSTGLVYQVAEAGKSEASKGSGTVVANYKSMLIDGKEFDNPYTHGGPPSLRLDGAIPGRTEGLKNIKKGGKIKLAISSRPAYGKAGAPGISPNSTLVPDIELLDVRPAPKVDAKPEADTRTVDSTKK